MSDSKMKLIKTWIETCDLLNGNKIDVDYLKDKPLSYSIDRTLSNPIYEKFILTGTAVKQITFDFTVTAPISSQALVNLQNSAFCEDFMSWVEVQNLKKNFPSIDGAESIECTSPGYILKRTETTAIYIIQMRFTYLEII